MPNYTHVQFLSWEIYTGPNRGPLPWSRESPGTSYTGFDNIQHFGEDDSNAADKRLDIEAQIVDIEERLQFTYKAMTTAHDSATRHPSTLKVFMAPEFLYRGSGGAYIHDLINGWTKRPAEFNLSGYERFPGLFGYLKTYARELQFEHWLFVFGTAISASFPAKYEHGKWVLDATKMGEIYNTALIQRGGEHTDDAYASRKHYKSGIDFIKQYLGAKAFTDGEVIPLDRMELEPNETNREGSAIFKINGVNDKDGNPIIFGLEVCLDHAASTLATDRNNPYKNWGRIRTANEWVKIQLVPSGGMSLQTNSIRLLTPAGRSYAFNCDGLTPLPATQWGAHTQLWNGTNEANKLFQGSYALGERFPSGTGSAAGAAIKVDDQLWWDGMGRNISATDLWDGGAGYIRVMQEQPL